MRCSMCGVTLTNRIAKVNGVLMCESCARDYIKDSGIGMTRDSGSLFGSSFPMLDELANAFLTPALDLDFANKRITCSKCQSSLRDIESTGRVGCIECYNTFNETILKSILKRQGNSKYIGRKPGEDIQLEFDDISEETNETVAEASENKSTTAKAETPVAKEEKTEENKKALEEIKASSDLSALSEDELTKAMKDAVAAEDYALAAKIRDEIMARKGDK